MFSYSIHLDMKNSEEEMFFVSTLPSLFNSIDLFWFFPRCFPRKGFKSHECSRFNNRANLKPHTCIYLNATLCCFWFHKLMCQLSIYAFPSSCWKLSHLQ